MAEFLCDGVFDCIEIMKHTPTTLQRLLVHFTVVRYLGCTPILRNNQVQLKFLNTRRCGQEVIVYKQAYLLNLLYLSWYVSCESNLNWDVTS